MAKITRATQKLFGSTANAGRLSKYGSLAAGSPVTYSGSTVTPANIQALSNFLQGLDGGVIGNNSPAIQDQNSLFYLAFYQLAYLLQQGIPEYDASTTYYTNSFCQVSGTVYVSLIDNNTGNTPASSPSDWQLYLSNLTGSMFANNPNFPGKSVQAGSQNVVVSNTNTTNGLAVIRGVVTSTGSITSGEGFTITHVGTGDYKINFSTSFGDIPAVTVTIHSAGGMVQIFSTSSSLAEIFTLSAGGANADFAFSFIAVGERA